MNKRIILLLSAILLISRLSYSGTSTGWTLLRRIKSPKPKPITCVASIRGDLSGVFYNPATIASIQDKEVFIIGETGMGDDTIGSILYGLPMENFSISCGLTNYDAGKTDFYWIEGGEEMTRTTSLQSDYMVLFNIGKYLSDSFSVGGTIKLLSSTLIETYNSQAYAIDAGLIYMISQDLSVTMALQNIGVSTKYLNQEEKLPTCVWLGGAYTYYTESNLFMTGGIEIPYLLDEERFVPSIGAEIGKGAVSLFVDYRLNADDSLINLGISIYMEQIDFAYSYQMARYLAQTSRFSVGIRF